MSARDEATLAQIRAARPDRSTWLSANAGSGKTRVLTDRVARLLLNGVNPQHILCLTYTKAAASEMQNRLFKRLGRWAMLPDDKLHDALIDLGLPDNIPADTLADARRLFALAIETPGGLKIQTIHAFASSILRRFPLEAGVSPRFQEMDDRAAALLRQDVLETMADGEDRPLVAAIAQHISSDESLADLAKEIAGAADAFRSAVGLKDALALFDLPQDFEERHLCAGAFIGGERALLDDLLRALREGSARDLGAADKLEKLQEFDLSALPVLESVFLTGASAKEPFSAKLGSFPTKPSQAKIASLMPELESFMLRIEAIRPKRIAFAAAQKTAALHAFARRFVEHFEARKQARGWLDFDDLITRARALLNDRAVAEWVLYRLDGGIDHILVDEAQDTSPAQWNVIERLAQEFTAGEGAQPAEERTLFIVGDKKQSIYSFQGADPREFDKMRTHFRAQLESMPEPLQDTMLEYSFRSSQAVLSLVDRTFDGREAAGFSSEQRHRAFFDALPGRVDLWPVVEKSKAADKTDWHDPVDLLGEDHEHTVLAREIAAEIKRMIVEQARIPEQESPSQAPVMRPVHEGDFLILVQRRSPLFHMIIQECKSAGLKIAGADRLRIGGELAVRDIVALLKFLSTPEDDLALAEALKSPLLGWSEQQLFTLAHKRKGYLWEALRGAAKDHPETLAILDDMRRKADFLRPYDLIERILTRHRGRKNLLSRLGIEAEDGIDALLAQALAYEQNSVPSLTGFLVWVGADDIEIKRQMEAAGRQIRVMTVHGAKGLEAPIVILPDTAKRDVQIRNQILSGDHAFWKMAGADIPPLQSAWVTARKEREMQERDRLLYVAMTRAEKWLIVCAAGDLGKDGEAWHDKVRTGMETLDAAPHSFGLGKGLRLEQGDWAGLETSDAKKPDILTVEIPAWATTPAPIVAPRQKALSPSGLGGAKALPGEAGLDEEAAKRRGRQVHRLLEFLPHHNALDWPSIAARLLEYGPEAAQGEELSSLLAEATKVLTNPALEPLFTGSALCEVPLSAALPELNGRRIHGVIDRLIITDDKALAIDFKTNAVPADSPQACPVGLLRQMGAYASALAQIFPDKPVETALLWTRNATLMLLPHDLVSDALRNTQMLDAPPEET
ncbi:double-strand break repair helicase AddA [Aquicoccus sp. G2-2]|uniref:double-strand break repair helicase AddA n=1 Tax=Aquicoccus sp. G2-2 TaxID=3092120 RepID=UPI002ADF080E|nr:double-strand break repair helicase AddA [Aquicoccus sp. G2-2]MEA1114728.1 double-strand break repair helicase AddA [Aquicoccus sp. G2-2]